MRVASTVELTPEQTNSFERWAGGRKMPVRLAERAKIVLRCLSMPAGSSDHGGLVDHSKEGFPVEDGRRLDTRTTQGTCCNCHNMRAPRLIDLNEITIKDEPYIWQ